MTGITDRQCALLNLGGTIGEVYGATGLARRLTGREILDAAGLPQVWPAHDIALIDSVEMTFEAIERAAEIIAADLESAGFLICCGTDLLEEIAYAASLLLPAGRPLVVTAAAVPASEPGTDGPANLRRAAALIVDGAATGAVVVMGDMIFAATGLVKAEPQALQPFAAADGAIGRFRAGTPPPLRPAQGEHRFRGLPARHCLARVAILTEQMGGVGAFIDPGMLDGLVVAGAGVGGLSARTRALLRELYLPNMPVVLSTRCSFGFEVDLAVAKYALAGERAEGFRIDDYTQLSAVQARIRLILEIGLTTWGPHA